MSGPGRAKPSDSTAALAVPLPGGTFSGLVPLAPGEDAHVAGRYYYPQDVRMLLAENDGVWTASFRRARAYTISEFVSSMHGVEGEYLPFSDGRCTTSVGRSRAATRAIGSNGVYGHSVLLTEVTTYDQWFATRRRPALPRRPYPRRSHRKSRRHPGDGHLSGRHLATPRDPRLPGGSSAEIMWYTSSTCGFSPEQEKCTSIVSSLGGRNSTRSQDTVHHAERRRLVAHLDEPSVQRVLEFTRTLPDADAELVPQRILARLNQDLFP
jgi:hypothetical protein